MGEAARPSAIREHAQLSGHCCLIVPRVRTDKSVKTFIKDPDGYLTISEEGIKRYFAADLSRKNRPS